MTNGKPFDPRLAHLIGIGPVGLPKITGRDSPLKLQVVSTPNKVTMAFDKPITYLALEPNSARQLAGTIVQAADEADKREEERKKKAEEEKDGTSGEDHGGHGGSQPEEKKAGKAGDDDPTDQ